MVQYIHEHLLDTDVISLRLGAVAESAELLFDLTYLVVDIKRAQLHVNAGNQRVPPWPARYRFAPPCWNSEQHSCQRVTVPTCICWEVQGLVSKVWHGARQATG